MPPKCPEDRLISRIERTKKQITTLSQAIELPIRRNFLSNVDLKSCGVNELERHLSQAKQQLRELKRAHKPALSKWKETRKHAKKVKRQNRARQRILAEEARWAAFPAKPNRRVIDLSSNDRIFDFLERRTNGTSQLLVHWSTMIDAFPSTPEPSFETCERLMNEIFILMYEIQKEIAADPGTRFVFRKAERVEDLMIKLSVLVDGATGYEARFNIFIGEEFQTGIHNHSRSFFSHVIHGSYRHDLWSEHTAPHCDDCVETTVFQRGWANGQVALTEMNDKRFVCCDEEKSHVRREGHVMFLDADLVHTVSSQFRITKEQHDDGTSLSSELYHGVTLVLLLPKKRTHSNFYVVGDDKEEFFNERQVRIDAKDTWVTVHDLCHLVDGKKNDRRFERDLGCPGQQASALIC